MYEEIMKLNAREQIIQASQKINHVLYHNDGDQQSQNE